MSDKPVPCISNLDNRNGGYYSLLVMSSAEQIAHRRRRAVKIVDLIPIPICWGLMGAVVFALIDALTGQLFGRFIGDVWQAVLASALWGLLLGYLAGWYGVSKFGLPRSASLTDLAAAAKAKNGSAPRP